MSTIIHALKYGTTDDGKDIVFPFSIFKDWNLGGSCGIAAKFRDADDAALRDRSVAVA